MTTSGWIALFLLPSINKKTGVPGNSVGRMCPTCVEAVSSVLHPKV